MSCGAATGASGRATTMVSLVHMVSKTGVSFRLTTPVVATLSPPSKSTGNVSSNEVNAIYITTLVGVTAVGGPVPITLGVRTSGHVD